VSELLDHVRCFAEMTADSQHVNNDDWTMMKPAATLT